MRFLLHLAGCFFHAMPDGLLALICRRIGWVLSTVMGERRRVLCGNLQRCFEGLSADEAWQMSRESFDRVVEMGLFVLLSPHFSVEEARRRFVAAESFSEALRDLAESPVPTVALVPHFTLMEAGTFSPVIVKNAPLIGALYRPLNQASIDRWVLETRERNGLKLISRRRGLSAANAFLKKNGSLIILPDQHAGAPGVLTTFFDRLISATELPGLLAARHGARVLAVAVRRVGFLKAEIHCDPLPTPSDPVELTLETERWLERKLRDDPVLRADWLWLHNRWRIGNARYFSLSYSAKRDAIASTLAFRGLKALRRLAVILVTLPDDVASASPFRSCLSELRISRPDAAIHLIGPPVVLEAFRADGLCEKACPLPGNGGRLSSETILGMRRCPPDIHLVFASGDAPALEAVRVGSPVRAGLASTYRRRRCFTRSGRVANVTDEASVSVVRNWLICECGMRPA